MLSRGQIRANQKYRDTSGSLFLAALAAAFALFISAKFIDVFHIFQDSFFTHLFHLLTDTKNYLNFLNNYKFKSFIFYIIPTFAMIASALLAWAYFGRERDAFTLLRGRRLLRGREAVKATKISFQKAVEGDEKGLALLPDIHITRSQEVKSILVCGAQGGGKTVFINQLLTTILERGDRCIIFDPTKGDFSTWIPNSLLISSTDSRSSHWWLGYDIQNLSDAQAFAQGLIEESSEPLWSNAARGILVACILKLQNELGQHWSWKELADLVFLPISELKEIAEKNYPPAVVLLEEDSKTSQSMVMNMVAYMVPVYVLGETFSKIQGKKLSLVSWLNSNKKQKNLVVQMNQRDAATGAALSRAIVELLTSRIASLEFLNSKSRRICFSLDEIPQFGRLDNISRLMEVGRSKGVYCIFGFQDISQINQLYKPHEAQKWAALFGVKVFPQVVGRDSQDWVTGQIGEQEVQYLQKSVSGVGDGKQNVSMSYSQPTTRQVLLSSELDPILWKGKLMIFYQLVRSFHETYSPSFIYRSV